MIHYDQGITLTHCRLALDYSRRQAVSFISHAHHDHIARHELALCSEETSQLYQFRLGTRRTRILPYRKPYSWGNAQLTIYPAGHCLGSTMLLVEYDDQSILYTGDFKLNDCHTCQAAEVPQAKTLVIESTFAHPQFVFPTPDVAAEQLAEAVNEGFAAGKIPLVEAYTLGKAQVITKMLTAAGFRVVQSPDVFAISQIYEEFDINLGDYDSLSASLEDGVVFVVSPRFKLVQQFSSEHSFLKIATTGWALDDHISRQFKADRVIAISDHADFSQLLETVERVNPETVYCTHGPPEHIQQFVTILKKKGLQALALPPTK